MSDSSKSPKNGNSKPYRSEEFPVVSWPEARQAAAQRRREFPYRFPRDHRHLGGKFSVKTNSQRLLRFFYFERCLMHGLGSWTLSIPEFEVSRRATSAGWHRS